MAKLMGLFRCHFADDNANSRASSSAESHDARNWEQPHDSRGMGPEGDTEQDTNDGTSASAMSCAFRRSKRLGKRCYLVFVMRNSHRAVPFVYDLLSLDTATFAPLHHARDNYNILVKGL